MGVFRGTHLILNEETGIRKKCNSQKKKQFSKQQKHGFRRKKVKEEMSELAYEMATTLNHHFPDLHQRLSAVADVRQAPQYRIEEIVGGAIALFLFKTGSRNAMDNLAGTGGFRENFYRLFHLKLPTMDTVAKVFEEIAPQELAEVKTRLVKHLIEKRVFDKQRYNGKFLIAIDGTGIMSFQHKHCDKCCKSTYKPTAKRPEAKTVYFHRILEAKLITESGFSISLCSEWIENEGSEYNKQDCELKAFTRLADTLKYYFPRTRIILCADGLYPNNTFFRTCKTKNWDYIVTLPNKSLTGFWEKIRLVNRQVSEASSQNGSVSYHQNYEFINTIAHNGYTHNWIQTRETKSRKNGQTYQQRFVHLTNIELRRDNVHDISRKGRLRWRIEKEGFDQQKNEGYNITHKYCRKSYTGMKNFYQVCQIAHLFNQLLEMSKNFRKLQMNKITKTHLWYCLWATMLDSTINKRYLARQKASKKQIEYVQEKVYVS